MRLHHIQISMPRGQEVEARRFYVEGLGMSEASKPPALAGRGGCWFRALDAGTVVAEVHLGVEDEFIPAKKAHPGLVCDSLQEWETLAGRLDSMGYDLSWAERETFEGYLRFHVRDGFGNRLEIMTPAN
ncbi:VOC family protein [Glutamicibacter arilaitensis]|uniref:Glyoxalase n=1 Tax=Glutamicibacter arilaitensis TaxID=256701 RepID=A0A4Y8TYK8_9MICC|nr:VOC family protein [Glutamicibacter arilaitensis]TFH56681.1 glyoxalase [Glutamicibacter arilaitensis]